jgi:hypothetical protein
VGTALHLAPLYEPDDSGLVDEGCVRALEKSCFHVWRAMREGSERKGDVEERVDEEGDEKDEVETLTGVELGSSELSSLPGEAARQYVVSTPLIPTQVVPRAGSRGNLHPSLQGLDVHESRESSSLAQRLRPSSAQSGLTSLTAGSEALRLQHYPGQSASTTNSPLLRPSSRMVSSTSLANSAVHNARVNLGEHSSTADPTLLRPSSRVDSHAPLSSLSIPSGDYTAPRDQAPHFNTVQAPSMPSMTAYAPTPSLHEHSFTPHDRARYLSDSAPGSRLASVTTTPYASRPVSPTQHTHSSSLRQISSTSRLAQLLVDDRMSRTCTPLSDVTEGNTLLSHTRLSLDEAADTNSGIEDPASPPYSRNKPIGTGRPRRASMALNHAYNAANPLVSARTPKCALHGEECDGVTVTETWKTQRARETTGFKDLYPVVSGAGDRVMVDWMKLLAEERG